MNASAVLGTVLHRLAILCYIAFALFPLFWLLSGAGFVDAGNTFTDEKGIVFRDLAVGAGVGLRIRTPLAPVRIDLGFPVRSTTGQTSIRWHFSIGQIF